MEAASNSFPTKKRSLVTWGEHTFYILFDADGEQFQNPQSPTSGASPLEPALRIPAYLAEGGTSLP